MTVSTTPSIVAGKLTKAVAGGHSRSTIQEVFMRVCRDSGFRLEATRAAHFAARVLGIHALDVWMTMDLDVMGRIASGEHPVVRALLHKEEGCGG